MLTPAQAQRIDALKWYHAIDFGSAQTPGRFPADVPPNHTLFGVFDMLNGIDVRGMKVLEIGPAHGVVCIGLALRGADVTVCNLGAGKPPQIAIQEEVFGVSLDYRPQVSVEDAPRHFAPASFDLIVCAGVLYHLINPADVFFRLRPLLRRGGLLVMETVYSLHKEPVITMNSETGETDQVTTYFLPSRSALEAMARLACFDVLATRINSPRRFSMTALAALPDEIGNRAEMCQKIHAFGQFEDPIFPLQTFAGAELSSILYVGERGHRDIDVRTFEPEFAPSPVKISTPLGKRF